MPPQRNNARIAAGMALPFLRQLGEEGGEIGAILESFGLCEEKLSLPEARVPHETWIQLLEACQAASGDPSFALRASLHHEARIHPLLYHLVSSQQTLHDVLFEAARYLGVLFDGISADLDSDEHMSTLRIAAEPGLPLPPIAVEFLLARWVSYGHTLLEDTRYEITEIHFTHDARFPSEVYEQILQSRVRFGAEENGIVFPTWNLELPIVSANEELKNALKDKVEQLLARLSEQPSLSTRVRTHLMSQLQYANIGVDTTARHFNMSERTLRRQLKEEGTTYKQILSDLRRELAIKYLEDNDLSNKEIALLLGYAELSTFHRAFKSWTKLTPSEFRRL